MPWRKPTATTTARNYGNPHQKARRAAAARHRPTDPCARCGHPLGDMGPWLHYDHRDDRTGYLGFSHGDLPCPVCGHRCNRRAGAKKARRVWEANKARAKGKRVLVKVGTRTTSSTASRW